MVYISLLIMLILFSISEEFFKNNQKDKTPILFVLASIVLTAILCMRFGQGTDYPAYMTMYEETGKFDGLVSLFSSNMHGEKGYHLICYICRKSGIPFEIFVFFWSTIEMFLLCRFIYRFSSHRTLSLLLAFHTLYLTYIFSAFRQGFVLSVFLGILLPLLLENKIAKYIFGVFLCSSIHSSAVVLLLPIFIRKVNFKNTESIIIFILFCFLLSGMITPFTNVFLVNYFNFSEKHLSVGANIFALLKRAVFGILIIYLYRDPHHSNDTDKNIRQLYKVYLLGFIVYIILLGNSLVASRLTFYLESLEIILIPNAMTKEIRQKLAILSLCIIITCAMYYKNIAAYISLGEYYSSVNVFNYPYINIFNESAFSDYRMTPLRDIHLIYGRDSSFF